MFFLLRTVVPGGLESCSANKTYCLKLAPVEKKNKAGSKGKCLLSVEDYRIFKVRHLFFTV